MVCSEVLEGCPRPRESRSRVRANLPSRRLGLPHQGRAQEKGARNRGEEWRQFSRTVHRGRIRYHVSGAGKVVHLPSPDTQTKTDQTSNRFNLAELLGQM